MIQLGIITYFVFVTHNCQAPWYECICNDGYRLTSGGEGDQTCMDIDECSEGKANCGEHGVCVNTGGSFECVCGKG